MSAPAYGRNITSLLVCATVYFCSSCIGECAKTYPKRWNLRINADRKEAVPPLGPRPFQADDYTPKGAGEAHGRQRLAQLFAEETACHVATQPIIVIDGGSTGTRPYLFTVQTRSCPKVGRVAQEETLKFLAEGRKFEILRMLIQEWLICASGEDWARQESTSKSMFRYISHLEMKAAELVSRVLQEAVRLLEKNLTATEQEHASLLGIPVIFHSTAGVRDLPGWYLSAYFAAFRRSINGGHHHRTFRMFTNPDLARPLTGQEEGMYTFFTINHLTGRLAKVKKALVEETANPPQPEDFAGLVEIGGSSVQIVLPLDPLEHLPSFIKLADLQDTPLFEGFSPRPKVLSVSFMQLGASASRAVLLKTICGKDLYLSRETCMHPCLPKGYNQPCSLGPIKVMEDGHVEVDDRLTASNLNSAANFCSSGNEHVASKRTVQGWCKFHALDPDAPLADKLQIEKCKMVEGTGDFDNCFSEVEYTLLDSPVPLPANMEAIASGFENLAQIFRSTGSPSTIYICGAALVSAVNTLKKYNFLPQDWDGRNVTDLVKAAREFCKVPVTVDNKNKLMFQMPTSGGQVPYTVGPYTYDLCAKLAQIVSTLSHMLRHDPSPQEIIFQNHIGDAELTWHFGAVLDRIMRREYWAHLAYESGVTHSLTTT